MREGGGKLASRAERQISNLKFEISEIEGVAKNNHREHREKLEGTERPSPLRWLRRFREERAGDVPQGLKPLKKGESLCRS